VTAAVFGLLGVVVGGLITAGVEMWMGLLSRRRNARAAARILFADIHYGRSLIRGSLQGNRWWPEAIKLPLDNWERYREALAVGIRLADWGVVAATYDNFELLERERAGAISEGVLAGAWDFHSRYFNGYSDDATRAMEALTKYLGSAAEIDEFNRAVAERSLAKQGTVPGEPQQQDGESGQQPQSPESESGGTPLEPA
jgi:hypothetical protein